ncbi:hypothetical protein Tco_0875179, partial [Tanacetum coccineum]
YGILVSKNDVLYFNAIPCDGIYEIDMLNLLPNVNSFSNVSNKRATHNLDFTYLWNYRLAHISKKRNEKHKHDGLFRSTDSESFDQSISCLSGKMTRKPFPHRTKRAINFLGLIHTDVYGPLRHVSRQGPSNFITFMDDNSHHGYGCEALMKRDTLDKLQQSYVKCIFVGYPKETLGYVDEEKEGLRGAKKLKQGADYLYMGNGICSQVGAFGSFNLVLPNGLVICLDNCHHAPTITRGVVSVSRLVDNGFIQCFTDYGILVSKDDVLYFNTIPCDGYPKETLGYYFYFPPKNKIAVARYVEFLEKNLVSQEASGKAVELREIQDEDTSTSKNTSKNLVEPEGFEPPQEYVAPFRRSVTPKEVKHMKNVPYLAVESNMCAVRYTRTNVVFAQYITSRFQQDRGKPHWTTVKSILKYLRNTKDIFLVYGGNLEAELIVTCYCDFRFETDRDDIKSHRGYIFILNGGTVDWKSSKQSTLQCMQ